MSQTEHRALDVNDPGEANRQGIPPFNSTSILPANSYPDASQAHMPQNQEPTSIFTDSSEPLFTMYLKKTGYSNKLVDSWTKYIDNVVIFVRIVFNLFHAASHIKLILQMSLFSAVVAALLSVTVADLKEDPQKTSAFYLENIYKLQLADSNASRSLTPDQPPLFSASKTAILANALLFMSLCLNVFAALMALSIRAFVPRYLLKTAFTQFSPHSRARTQEILASEWYDSKVFDALIAILWLSPFFFFVGVSVYLFDINRAVFGPVVGCICLAFVVDMLSTNWLDEVNAYSRVFADQP
jgi:Family of unknown function (DUF6535)